MYKLFFACLLIIIKLMSIYVADFCLKLAFIRPGKECGKAANIDSCQYFQSIIHPPTKLRVVHEKISSLYYKSASTYLYKSKMTGKEILIQLISVIQQRD